MAPETIRKREGATSDFDASEMADHFGLQKTTGEVELANSWPVVPAP